MILKYRLAIASRNSQGIGKDNIVFGLMINGAYASSGVRVMLMRSRLRTIIRRKV